MADEKGLEVCFKDIVFKEYKPDSLVKIYDSISDGNELNMRSFTYFMIEFLSKRKRVCAFCYNLTF